MKDIYHEPSLYMQYRFIHWVLEVGTQGPGWAQKGPDKQDLTRFSGYKSRSSSAKEPVDLLLPGPEISLNRHCVYVLYYYAANWPLFFKLSWIIESVNG
ncbi:hypothetical protein TNCV_2794021 [Trichonephila clavipes]|nr:hypothetical protein TNCV_2794021 [Trichonephila clavipes]